MKQAIRKYILSLQSRQGWKKSSYFICEGLRCCREAIERRPDWVEAIIYEETFDERSLSSSSLQGERIAATEFRELANTENPQGVMLLMRRPDFTRTFDYPSEAVLVLDRLSDPGNVGTILRTAWAMGISTVAWTVGTCHPLGAKAIRAGMGAQFVLNLPCIPSVSHLKGCYPERTLWLTSPRAEISCDSAEFVCENSFIVLGNEAEGVEECPGARYVKIDMPGSAESLNVAQAATIFMYEAARQSRS